MSLSEKLPWAFRERGGPALGVLLQAVDQAWDSLTSEWPPVIPGRPGTALTGR